MAASSAEYYEVRWRIQGSDEAWSNPQRVSPVGEIVVTELERDKSYDFQVRSVSNCGAKSLWVDGSHAVPTTPAGTLTLAEILASAADAQAAADAANLAIANIASDGILAAGEKPPVIRDYSVITTEQAGIDAQATAYGITAEKTTYDSKVAALTTYLGSLTSPTTWNDLLGNTTIDGPTFRTKFADVYTSRQALLNAIYAAAKAKADTAKAAADAAQTTATQGVSLATNVPVINGGFDTPPVGYGWAADSGSGWFTDTTGVTPGVGPNGARHNAGAGSGAYRNAGLAPCQPGQVYKAQGLIKAVGANGQCYIYISWCNAAGAEIGTKPGNTITGTATAGSFAVGTAPTGTVYARTCIGVTGHTAGYYAVDNVLCSQFPASLDEVPDSATYLKSLARTQGLVENGDFEIGDATAFPPPGWQLGSIVVGSAVTSQGYDTTSQYSGTRSLTFVANQYNGYESVRSYPVKPGDYYAIGGWTVGVNAIFALYFLSAANAVTGNITITGTGYSVATGKVPAGSVSAKLVLASFAAGSNVAEFDALFMARCSSYDNTLAISGSGQQVGDQRNLVSSITRNLGITRSAVALTANAGGSVDINAHTI